MIQGVFDSVVAISGVIFLLPLAVFVFLILFGRRINKYRGIMATIVMFICTCLSLYVFFNTWGQSKHMYQIPWFTLSEQWTVHFGIRIDYLSSLLILIVTFVSFLVHLFSIEYLRGDRHFEKYFSYLGLFTFAMLGIIISSNLLQIFFFWELVGLSSYLLVGFYFQKESAIFSSKKAFLVNRIGDVGFMLGLMIVYYLFGTLDIETLMEQNQLTGFGHLNSTLLIVAGIGFFWGSVGKSAQFPLQVWLPNAMEGPTPVSALIHAATMVAAGVYLLARVSFMLEAEVFLVITIVGSITVLIGAFSAISQTDIKRVLAFSTISQLGYMMIGIGVGACDAALFHLMTHAFFKAGLFLAAGAVIHSMHHVQKYGIKKNIPVEFDPQDMRLMGGLRKKMPVTFICFVICACALAGLPLFSGFLSKDAIINASFAWASASGSDFFYLVPAVALLTAFLTAFYMFRQVFLVFFHEFRLPKIYPKLESASSQLIEAPVLMRVPLIVLAALSVSFVFSWNPLNADHSWFFAIIEANRNSLAHLAQFHVLTSVLSICMTGAGLGLAYYYFRRPQLIEDKVHIPISKRNIITRLSYNHGYGDQFNDYVVVRPQLAFSKLIYWLDRSVVDGFVHLLVSIQVAISRISRGMDQGIDHVINYGAAFVVVKAYAVKLVDKYIVDGIVLFSAYFVKFAGNVTRSPGRGMIQVYIGTTILVLLVLISLLSFAS